MRPLAVSVVLALCVPAQPQESWDLANCQRFLTEPPAKAGHVCTPEHLEADLAQLLKEWKGTGTTIDATKLREFLHGSAERGMVELGAAAERSQAELKQAQANVDMVGRLMAQLGGPVPAGANGSGLLDWCEWVEKERVDVRSALCTGYITGVADSLALHGLLDWLARDGLIAASPAAAKAAAGGRPPIFFCPPPNGDYGQLVRVVLKFLRDHPERLHEHRRALVEEALEQAFPCPVK